MARSIGVSTTGHDQLALKAHPGPALGGARPRVNRQVLLVEVDEEGSLPEAVDVVVRGVAGLAW